MDENIEFVEHLNGEWVKAYPPISNRRRMESVWSDSYIVVSPEVYDEPVAWGGDASEDM